MRNLLVAIRCQVSASHNAASRTHRAGRTRRMYGNNEIDGGKGRE